MCLALPMQIIDIENDLAECELNGVRRKVSLFLIADQQVQPGDYVLVHVGYALQKVSLENAVGNLETYLKMSSTIDTSASEGHSKS